MPGHDDDETKRIEVHDSATVTPSRSARSSSRAAFEAGAIVAGRYRIVRFIARGGMGEVYEADDLELHDRIALKTIRPEVAEDALAVERFRREIQIARKVTHPNVCRVFDLARDGDVMFVTMELLEGHTLREQLVRNGRLSTHDALPIAKQIADGLGAAHRAGVIHRDLKSANVMIVPDPNHATPRVVVTDFGLARSALSSAETITNSGAILGSPAYMSPEQIEGRPLSSATDIYAFGVVLYEMVTCGHPFEAETPLASVLKRLREPPAPPRTFVPDLDPVWERTILRCLEREPEDRFPDTASVIDALESGSTRALPSRRRKALRFSLAAAIAIAVIASIAWFVPWTRMRVAPRTTATQQSAARRAIAVTGFRNQSARPESAWLATALAEMLTTEIAAGEQVRVISGETVARSGIVVTDPARMHNAFGADYLVSGAYVVAGGQLRVDVQLQEALGGNVLASFAETGPESQLFELVSRAGSRLREKLGVASPSPEEASGILASLPSNAAAVRFYAEGLAATRAYDDLSARAALEKAIELDRDFPLAHAALAGIEASLGYDARAKREAQIAFEHASKLPRESRLIVEAQAHVQNGRLAQAAEIYQALWRFYPDNLDYATQSAFALVDAGKGSEALALVETLKKSWNDARVELAEADAAEATSDYPRARAAALRALQMADARGQRLLGARARLTEGYALLRMAKLPEALAAFEDCRRRYEAGGNRTGVHDALGGIGSVFVDQEKFDDAMAVFQQAQKISHATGSVAGEASDLHNIAYVLQRKGDLAGAKQILQRALELERETGNQAKIAGIYELLGNVSKDAGEFAEAIRLYEQALAINEQIGALHAAGNNRNNLAIAYNAKGDLEGAERLFRQALETFRQTHDDTGAADVLNNLASTQRARGEIAEAEQSYQQAEEIYRRMNSRSDLALIAVNVATIRVDRGDLAGATTRAQNALDIWRSTGEKSYAAYALMTLADIAARRGELARAEAIARQALQERLQMGEQSTAAESQLALADFALDAGRTGEAEKLATAALASFSKEDRADMMASANLTLCRAALAKRNLSVARSFLQSAGTLATRSGDASVRFNVAIADARLATASGKPVVAIQQLTPLLAHATVPQQFEARLAIAEANVAAGNTAAARTQLDALQWDANKHGFRSAAAHAAALGSKSGG